MSKTIDVVDSSAAIDIMRLVVESEGLAPTPTAKNVDAPVEELALVDGEQQGELTWFFFLDDHQRQWNLTLTYDFLTCRSQHIKSSSGYLKEEVHDVPKTFHRVGASS